MKRLLQFSSLGLVCICFLFILAVKVNAQELSGEINLSITINEDVVLTGDVTLNNKAKIIIGNNADVKFDLNGYNLKQSSDNYAIDNSKGTLYLIDSENGGSVICTSSTSSCIRNYKNTKIEGVKIESVYTAVKNEELSNLQIIDSDISSKIDGTVMNYGEMSISNSNISNETSVAVYALTYLDYFSNVQVSNSNINAPIAVMTYYGYPYDKPTTALASVEIQGGTISANATFSLREIEGVNYKQGTLGISGNIEAPITALEYAKAGTIITLNSDINEGTYEVPANVKLDTRNVTISNEVKINISDPTNISLKEDETVIKNEDGTYSVIKKVTETNKGTTKKEENPNTFDNVLIYVILGIFGLAGLFISGLYLKKLIRLQKN